MDCEHQHLKPEEQPGFEKCLECGSIFDFADPEDLDETGKVKKHLQQRWEFRREFWQIIKKHEEAYENSKELEEDIEDIFEAWKQQE